MRRKTIFGSYEKLALGPRAHERWLLKTGDPLTEVTTLTFGSYSLVHL